MPKRIIDGEGLWRSDKIAAIQHDWMRSEFAWLLAMAFANGSFECAPRLVWSTCYAFNRPNVTLDMVEQLLAELERVKLLFRWSDTEGKVWGYWVGSEKPGRLPGAKRLEKKHDRIGAEVPQEELQKFITANGQPMADHPAANGVLGFGVGVGSGFGSGSGENPSSSPLASDGKAKRSALKPQPSEAGLRLATQLKQAILFNNRSHRGIEDKTVSAWAREADKMLSVDGLKEEQVATVITWCQSDSFWKANILSMGKLREKFDDLTVKMQSRGKPNGSAWQPASSSPDDYKLPPEAMRAH